MLLNCLVVACCIFSATAQRPLVKISLGLVEGVYKKSYNGRHYSAFEGIPYAQPPINDLRFKESASTEPWVGVWNATTLHTCMQLSPLITSVMGTEDCLYLNVYVPKEAPSSEDNFDVVVHIHGGGFMIGSPGMMAGPKYLMDKDVVYVNMNYRLGVLGFLSTEDDVVRGNNGMKDQVLALKWIQKHIKQFGGNPNSVTINGLSAGGASVHLHYFSKLSKGLFHKGIAQSGNALNPWVLSEGALERAKKLASLVGCNDQSSRDFVNCMKQRSAQKIVENTKFLDYAQSGFPISIFSPVIEKNSKEAFLDEHPYTLLKNKKFNDVPLISSITTEEGVLGGLLFLKHFENSRQNWKDGARYYMDYNYTACDSHREEIAERIQKYYFNDKTISEDTVDTIIKLVGDRYFAHGFEKSLRLQAANSKYPIYSYIYGYKNSLAGQFNKFFGIDKDYGVNHGEDCQLIYVFDFKGISFENAVLSESDVEMKDILLEMITTFAQSGIPKSKTFKWTPVLTFSSEFSYLSILNPKQIQMKQVKEISPTQFWDSLPLMENEKLLENVCRQSFKSEL